MKSYSRGAKRRAKKRAPAGIPEIEPTPKKQPNGRKRRLAEDRNKATENLKARCRQMGKEITPKNIRDMAAAWWGCHAGRVIGNEVMDENKRSQLWGAICEMRRITAAYDAACGAPKRHAACLRLLLPLDELSADTTTPPVDERSDEEKQRQAVSAWMRMHGWLGHTDAAARGEAMRVVVDDAACVDPVGLLSALRCVADGMTGKRLTYRGR